MRVVVDHDQCDGHGKCELHAPDVFRLEDDGSVTVLLQEPGKAQRAEVKAAETWCPKGAISIVETSA